MAVPREDRVHNGPGRPRKDPEGLAQPVAKWAEYLRPRVDAWPVRREAAEALGTEESRLSRIVRGEVIPSREWLATFHEAYARKTGRPVSDRDRKDAAVLYMEALRAVEEAARERTKGRNPHQRRSVFYQLEDKLGEALHREQEAVQELEQAQQAQRTLDVEVARLKAALARARADLPAAEADNRRLRAANEQQDQQLVAAAAYVRDLETQLHNRELQRVSMLETIRQLRQEITELRQHGHQLQQRRQRFLSKARIAKAELNPVDLLTSLIPVGLGLWTATLLIPKFTLHGAIPQQLLALLCCALAFTASIAVANTPLSLLRVFIGQKWYEADEHETVLFILGTVLNLIAFLVRVASYGVALWLSVILCHTVGLPVDLSGKSAALLSGIIAAAVSGVIVHTIAVAAAMLRAKEDQAALERHREMIKRQRA
ncbi:hypothetical protein [Streptomyces monashensis]|uniref:Uncharacterized protein n=1 Tax=Streptomyces monashensis TaxID=1678012 RepID=A0A1S2PTY2_9ACTN|nr:hypothetical protein [Streptomyces monashensis]OIJ97022.1 hypothetical protein BIV23_31500 [Streptomyces monashensis]